MQDAAAAVFGAPWTVQDWAVTQATPASMYATGYLTVVNYMGY